MQIWVRADLFGEKGSAASNSPGLLLQDTREVLIVVGGRGALLFVFGTDLLFFMVFDLIMMIVRMGLFDFVFGLEVLLASVID